MSGPILTDVTPACLVDGLPEIRLTVTPITSHESSQAPSAGSSTAAARAPLLLVVGNDALLAARPATAIQLCHAGLQAGFDAVLPGSWGDELVAEACARHLAARQPGPAVFCACPHVAQRVLGTGTDLAPFIASFLSPPAALSRYLRALYAPDPIRLTYVGRCPGAHGEAYDAIISPDEFLRLLDDRGIVPAAQPDAFEATVPPDRRRFHSLPGGMPVATSLRHEGAPHSVVELMADDFAAELAQVLLEGMPMLIDASARLGCACAGATTGGADCARDARHELVALEPPRAFAPVLELPVDGFDLSLPLPEATRDTTDLIARLSRTALAAPLPPDVAAPRTLPSATEQIVERGIDVESGDAPRRRSPAGGIPVVRPPQGFSPVARGNDGRILPRAYVARRRSGPRPAVDDERADPGR